jgi:hypothetical protein
VQRTGYRDAEVRDTARKEPAAGTRAGLTLSVWVAATSVGLGVAATTKVGPVVIAVSTHHGVHLGDLLAFSVAYTAALVITLRMRGSRRPRRRTAGGRRGRPDGRATGLHRSAPGCDVGVIGNEARPPVEIPDGAPQPPADHSRP